MSDKYYTLKEASTILNKSVRTVRRYLDKLSVEQRQKVSKLDGKRVIVSQAFIDMVTGSEPTKTEQNEPLKREDNSKDKVIEVLEKQTEQQKQQIEKLESKNAELFGIIKDKDEQLKQNLNDFKTLTSKVIYLQDELQKRIEAPKPNQTEQEQTEPNKKDLEQTEPQEQEQSILNTTLRLFAIVALFLLIVFVIVKLIE